MEHPLLYAQLCALGVLCRSPQASAATSAAYLEYVGSWRARTYSWDARCVPAPTLPRPPDRTTLSPADAAFVLQRPLRTILKMVRTGELTDVSCDARRRIDVGEVADLVAHRIASGELSGLAMEALSAVTDSALPVPHLVPWARPPALIDVLETRWRAASGISSGRSNLRRMAVPGTKT